MSSHLMNLLLTLLLSNSLLVVCLKCYVGTEGNTTEQEVVNPATRMCSYEPRGPCTFSLPPLYHIYEFDHYYAKYCWAFANRVVCSCRSDLCNGNIKLMQKKWAGSRIDNATVYECVKKYLEDRPDLPHPETTTEAEPTEAGTTTQLSTERATLISVVPDNPVEVAPARMEAPHTLNPTSSKSETESDLDFIIFLILVIVAAILLISIIPALLGCLAMKSKRNRRRRAGKRSASTMSGKSSKKSTKGKGGPRKGGAKSKTSTKSSKSTKSGTKSTKSGKSKKSRMSKKSRGKSARSAGRSGKPTKRAGKSMNKSNVKSAGKSGQKGPRTKSRR